MSMSSCQLANYLAIEILEQSKISLATEETINQLEKLVKPFTSKLEQPIRLLTLRTFAKQISKHDLRKSIRKIRNSSQTRLNQNS